MTDTNIKHTRDSLVAAFSDLQSKSPDRAITRNYFRDQTGIRDGAWEDVFGRWREFAVAAGEAKSRMQSKHLSNIARTASKDEVAILSEERKSYGGRYLRDKGKGPIRTVLGTSDWHDEEIDPFYERVLVDMVKRVQPDVVCLGGDIFDFPQFGKYAVDPRKWNPVPQILRALKTIGQIREAAPDAQIDLIEGNHEARVLNYWKQEGKALMPIFAELHGMGMREIFKLDQYEVNWVAKADLHAPTDATLKKAVEEKNYRIYYDALACHHHPWGKNLQIPGFNGHHHRHKVESKFSHDRQSYEWHQLGAGHIRRAVYTDADECWNNGFVLSHVYLPTKSVTFEYVDVGADIAVGGGEYYARTDDERY